MQLTWPNTTSTADTVGITVIYDGSNALPAGNYEFTIKWFADGTQITTVPQNTQVTMKFASGISGTTPALSSIDGIQTGYVCVNPSLVAAGDTLTARAILNGAVTTLQGGSTWWYAGSSSFGTTAGVTLTSQNIAAGIIAFKGTFGNTSGITAGTPYTADLSITNGTGTEVTYPCPSPVAATPVVTASTANSITATVGAGTSMCMARRVMGQMDVMAGIGVISGTTCTISPMGPSFTDGTYRIVATADSYWGNPSTSQHNPTVTYVSGSSSQNSNSNNQQQSQQQVSAPQVPTTIPVIAPIAVPVTGIKPGGALVIDAKNLSSLTSIKIDTTAATTATTATGVEIKVPAGLAPGAHDLLITTATGATLFVGAIKIADPAVVAAKEAQAKAAASISVRAPIDLAVSAGKKLSAAQVAAAKAVATQYAKVAKTIVCEAIPASKATAAAAKAAATKLCADLKAAAPKANTLVIVSAPSGNAKDAISAEVQG